MTTGILSGEIAHGEQLFREGAIEEALKIFESILEKEPGNLSALNNKGVSLYRLGKYHEATSTFLEVLRKDNNNTDAIHNLILNYQEIGNWKAVKTILTEYGNCLSTEEKETIINNLKKQKDYSFSSNITKEINLSFKLGDIPLKYKLTLNLEEFSQKIIWDFISHNRLYEEETSCFIATIVKMGDVVIDIGGHIGYFSLLASELVGKEGNVFTFEPSISNYNHIKRHITINKKTNIHAFNLALGVKNRETDFFLNLDNDGGHALWDVGTHSFNKISRVNQLVKKIKLETLNNFFRDKNLVTCKLIKIDAEGAEFDILRGGETIILKNNIPYIICEVNRSALRQMGTSEGELRKFMSELGYNTYCFSGEGLNLKVVKLMPDQYLQSKFVFNVLFSKDKFLRQSE
ncbi:MAG: FkbM family methyltransferase [Candidatus Scalinduaceae bacterium]